MSVGVGWLTVFLTLGILVAFAWLLGTMAARVGLAKTPFQVLGLIPGVNGLAFVFLLFAQLRRPRPTDSR